MRIAAAALILLTCLPAHADDRLPLIGDKVRVDTAFIGCREQDDEDRLKSLMRANDMDAFKEYVMDHVSTCHGFSSGDVGSVEDISAWHNSSCVRPSGRAYCYWFPTPMLKKV